MSLRSLHNAVVDSGYRHAVDCLPPVCRSRSIAMHRAMLLIGMTEKLLESDGWIKCPQ